MILLTYLRENNAKVRVTAQFYLSCSALYILCVTNYTVHTFSLKIMYISVNALLR